MEGGRDGQETAGVGGGDGGMQGHTQVAEERVDVIEELGEGPGLAGVPHGGQQSLYPRPVEPAWDTFDRHSDVRIDVCLSVLLVPYLRRVFVCLFPMIAPRPRSRVQYMRHTNQV